MSRRNKGGVEGVISRNMLKKSMLASCKKYAEQLERENYALKNDPNTVIGQFIGQFREMYGQNQRLSTLAAALIKRLDDKVTLSKDELEAYKTKRINIKWELPEGVEKFEDATEYIFTYELQDAPEGGQPVQATEQPGEDIPECTDPNCTLPKDLKHRHDPESVTVASEIDTTPEVQAGDTILVNGEEVTVTSVETTPAE